MSLHPTPRTPNQVLAVGTLDRQFRDGRASTCLHTRNALRGAEQSVLLQLPSPFGQMFALPVRLDGAVQGGELLADTAAGASLAVSGRLAWSQQGERRVGELVFHADAVRPAAPEDEPGCDVWLSGAVLSAPRIQRHPHRRSVLLAHTALAVSVERRRSGSRAHLTETERVPLVVPLHHPDAPNLLRPGNQVLVEGMLDRVVVELRGAEVERAVAALDAEWQATRAALHVQPDELRAAERHYRGRRRALCETVRSRVVAGYVELLAGAPASVREARALREAEVRARRRDPTTEDTRGA